MTERLLAPLGQLVEQFTKDSVAPDDDARKQLGEELAKLFRVQPDEVAILGITSGGNFLQFILPKELRAIGTIPINSTSALAARTARERKSDAMNNFSVVRHASVFEGVPLGRSRGEMIQKIMSAPILDGDKVVGVVQISRKGTSTADAGPDFTPHDLRQLIALSTPLSRFVRACQES